MTNITLQELFAELDRCEQSVPVDMLCDRLRRLALGPDDLKQYIAFSDTSYRRNLVRLGPGYAALVLCWKSGQQSPIHDHSGSACGLRVLRGTACEVRYDRRPDGSLVEGKTSFYAEGSVCGTWDADIHTVINRQPAGHELVTLHIYTPPLRYYHTYSAAGERRRHQDMEVLAEEQRRAAVVSAGH